VPRHDDRRQAEHRGPGAWGEQRLSEAAREPGQSVVQPRDHAQSQRRHAESCTGRHRRRRVRQPEIAEVGAQRTRRREQHRDGDSHDDRLPGRPLDHHGSYSTSQVAAAPTVIERTVHVAEDPRRKHRVQELRAVAVTDRSAVYEPQPEFAGDQAPPRRRRGRREQPEPDRGDQRGRRHRTDAVERSPRPQVGDDREHHRDPGNPPE
jgi:hypothetical protein